MGKKGGHQTSTLHAVTFELVAVLDCEAVCVCVCVWGGGGGQMCLENSTAPLIHPVGLDLVFNVCVSRDEDSLL